MVDHASGEDVDLFLETELFVDVKLTDADLSQLAAVLEQRRQQQLKDAQLAWTLAQQQAQAIAYNQAVQAAQAAAASQSNGAQAPPPVPPPPPPPPPPPQPSALGVSPVPVKPSALRRWHEAEIRQVIGRNVRVHFLEIPHPPQWINVDEGHDRLAELHVMTTAEREGRISKKEEVDLSVDCDEVFEEVLTRCRVAAFLAPPVPHNGHYDASDAALEQAMTDFLSRWFAPAGSSASGGVAKVGGVSDEDVEMVDVDEVFSERVTIPLFDPLTHSRITVPVRTAACQHVHCMDLMTHIQHQKSKLEWTCVCGKEAFANLLQIDLFLLHILQQMHPTAYAASSASSGASSGVSHDFGAEPETRHVVVSRDGSWTVQEDKDREKKKRKRDPVATSSSSSPVSSQPSSPHLPPAEPSPASSATLSFAGTAAPAWMSVTYPVVEEDGVEYIDLRRDDPYDREICDWLLQHWKVKTEKLEEQRRLTAPQEEKKMPSSAPSSSFFQPPPHHHSSPSYVRAHSARVLRPQVPFVSPPPPSASPAPELVSPARASHIKQNRPPQSPTSSSALPSSRPQLFFSHSSPVSAANGPPPVQSFQPRPILSSSSVAAAPLSSVPQWSSSAASSLSPSSSSALAPFPRAPFLSAPDPTARLTATIASTQATRAAPTLAPLPRIQPAGPAASPAVHVTISATPVPRPSVSAAPKEELNVNTCDLQQLRSAGFSLKISQRILDARAEKGAFGFQRLEELQAIKGIGKKTFERLQSQLQI